MAGNTDTESIRGLREQIIANAITLFPQVMQNHRARVVAPTVPDTDAFNVSICFDEAYHAILTRGLKGNEAIAAEGGLAATVEGALKLLLNVVGKALSSRRADLLRVKELHRESYEDGYVDMMLLPVEESRW